jgi:hypothetical protein
VGLGRHSPGLRYALALATPTDFSEVALFTGSTGLGVWDIFRRTVPPSVGCLACLSGGFYPHSR